VWCLNCSFKKQSVAIKPFPGLREHFRDVSDLPLNHKNSPPRRIKQFMILGAALSFRLIPKMLNVARKRLSAK